MLERDTSHLIYSCLKVLKIDVTTPNVARFTKRLLNVLTLGKREQGSRSWGYGVGGGRPSNTSVRDLISEGRYADGVLNYKVHYGFQGGHDKGGTGQVYLHIPFPRFFTA